MNEGNKGMDYVDRMKPATHVYIGRGPCGCVLAFAAYSYRTREHTGRNVAEMIKDGLIVSSMTFEEYQVSGIFLADCPHGEIVDENTTQPVLL